MTDATHDTIITPPQNWEPVPREYREWYWVDATPEISKHRATRFIQPVRDAIDRGEIEVKFVVKNNRYPDPKNRYHWRKKPCWTALEMNFETTPKEAITHR